MDSRQQFEENMRTKQKFEDGDFRIVSNGRYYWGTTQFAWEVWSESRESLVVELPDDGMEDCQREWGEGCKDTFDCGYNFSCAKHEQAIHEAGIRTK